MSFNFVIENFTIGGESPDLSPNFIFYRRGFNLGSGFSQPSWKDIILHGNTALTLVNAKANSLSSLKLFGGTEQTSVPSGYTQIEGVDNSSTAYVNTGLCPTVDDVEFEIRTKVSTTSSWYLFQSRTNTVSAVYGLSGSGTNATILLACGGTNLTSNITRKVGNIYTIKASLKNGVSTLYVKDETAGVEDTVTGTYTYSQPTANICLFGNTAGSQTLTANNTIYYARLKVSGAYVMNYIPAMQGSTVGFYDKVSESLKTATVGTLSSSGSAVPSPNNPIDIISNNGVIKYGQYGKNLFDKTTFDFSTSTTLKYVPIYVGDGTFTMSTPDFGVETSANLFFLAGSVDTGANSRVNGVWTNNAITQTSVNGYVTVATRTASSSLAKNPADYNWQIELGSTATPYEPYHFGIHTDGDVETVRVHGKNLWTGDFSQFDNIGGEESTYTYFKLPKENTYYTLSVTAKKDYTASGSVALGFSGTGGGSSGGIRWVIPTSGTILKGETKKFNNYNAKFLNFVCMYKPSLTTFDYISEYFDIQLEEGSSNTEYEPYFNGGSATAEMLLKVGDYQDVQSVLDGEVTRKVGVLVLDGTENWEEGGTSGANSYRFSLSLDIPSTTDVTALCTHIERIIQSSSTSQSDRPCIRFNTTGTALHWYDTDNTTTLAQFKQFLAIQYANGTPVTVVYPLATARTETVTAQPLTIQQGTNIVEITQASMDNLELEVSYKAGVEVTVTEIENAQLDNSVEVTVNG